MSDKRDVKRKVWITLPSLICLPNIAPNYILWLKWGLLAGVSLYQAFFVSVETKRSTSKVIFDFANGILVGVRWCTIESLRRIPHWCFYYMSITTTLSYFKFPIVKLSTWNGTRKKVVVLTATYLETKYCGTSPIVFFMQKCKELVD